MAYYTLFGGFLLIFCVVFIEAGSVDSKKQSCCGENQFEAKAGGKYLDKDGITNFYMPRISVDYTRKMMSFDEITPKYGNVSYIVDYPGQKMYAFSRAARVCTRTDVKQPMEGPCMPKDARFMGSQTVGYGKASLSLDAYGLYRETQGVKMTVYIDVTSEGCVPVTESSHIEWQGGLVDTSIFYTDYQPTIQDPSVFQVPSYCQNAKESDWSDHIRPAAHLIRK